MDISGVAVAVAAAVVGGFVAWSVRGRGRLPVEALGTLAAGLPRLQDDLARLGRAQEELRREVQRSRESSLRDVSQASQAIRADLFEARRALIEVKTLEESRGRQLADAAQSLRRLEAVVAGSSARGAAGENIVARALTQLPPDLLEINVAFGSRIVEYALRLPGGRLLPIDSKWTSVASLERLEAADGPLEPLERRRLTDQVARDLRTRSREMAKYLDPERTLGLGLLAVPDAVYAVTPEVHGEGYRDGVLVVPYSLALPYVLAVYRLTVRFGSTADPAQISLRLRTLGECLRRLEEEIEGRLSRGLVLVQNARDSLRDQVALAQRTTEKLTRSTVPEAPLPEGPGGRDLPAGLTLHQGSE
jgi:DNA recombination protein RmuC